MATAPEATPARPTRSLWVWLLFGGLLAFLLLRPMQSGQIVPYSDVKRRIEAGEITSAKLGRDRIIVELAPGVAPPPKEGAPASGPTRGPARGLARGKDQLQSTDEAPPPAATSEPGPEAPAAQPEAKPAAGKTDERPAAPAQLVALLPPSGDPTLVPLLDAHGVSYTGIQESDWIGNLLLAWVLPLGLLFLFWGWMMRRAGGAGGGIMSAISSVGRSRARLVPEEGTGVGFSDVAGVDEAVDELREVVDFLRTPERFSRLGGRIPKGVLLVGPPGTGKTLLARAVAGEAKVPFYSLTGSDFVELFVGVGAARVRDLFATAQAKAPCIIFIDELDAIGKARSVVGGVAGHDEREQTLNQLLSEMDGFDPRKALIVMAATNRPEILDPALLRPGRFDRQVLVDRPDLRGREAILRIHARVVRLGPDVELGAIARITPGFAGAELANVINEGALLAARRSKEVVGMSELNEAVERVVAGLEKKNRRMNPREKEIVAHHEAGHALLAQLLPTTDRVHKVSMIPRGLAALGYTMQLPLEDRYLLTRTELLDRICVLLGGRASETVVFGDVSTGAHDDLERATALARRMVTQFGMSQRLGPQALIAPEATSTTRLMQQLGAPEAPHVSEHTQEVIDAEVESLLRAAFARALAIIEANREYLLRLAAALLEREVLEGPELERAIVGAQLPPEEREPHAPTALH